MEPIIENRANVNPPLTYNKNNHGYTESDSMSVNDDDDSAITTKDESDDTDAEGSKRGKKKHKTSNGSNVLLIALKAKWEKDQEEDAHIQAENKAAQNRHLLLMERSIDMQATQIKLMKRNTGAACSIAESFKTLTERRD